MVAEIVTHLFVLLLATTGALAQLPPFKIVQLGDSYSSGNGARAEDGSVNYVGVFGCFRSPTNWGSQYARSLSDTFAVTYINRACSGARLRSITRERQMYPPAPTNVNGSCPTPDFPDEEFYKNDTSTPVFCNRYLRPQIDAIDETVDLVLVTIGGNDVGFVDIVAQCVMLTAAVR